MRDLDELRHALATETADLHVDLPPDRLRHRARRIRTRRTALVATALVVALAIPVGVLAAIPDRQAPTGKGRPAPVCVTPGADGTVPWIGAPVEVVKGAAFTGTGVHQVLVGVTYSTDKPTLTVVFHHEATGTDEYGLVSVLHRTPSGAFASDPNGGEQRIASVEVNYGNVLTLYLGLYAGLTDRITITTGQTSTEAKTVVNRETGWTLFWLAREPTGEDPAVRIDVLDNTGRPMESASGPPGPGIFVKPSPTPPPLPTFTPTC